MTPRPTPAANQTLMFPFDSNSSLNFWMVLMLWLFSLWRSGMLRTASWLMMFKSGDTAMPGVLLKISRWFTYLVPLMIARRSKVTRCVPFVDISGPSSTLMFAGLSLMIIAPSSTYVIKSRWLGCEWQRAVLPACKARAQVSCAANLQNVEWVVVVHSVTARTSSLHSAMMSSCSCNIVC